MICSHEQRSSVCSIFCSSEVGRRDGNCKAQAGWHARAVVILAALRALASSCEFFGVDGAAIHTHSFSACHGHLRTSKRYQHFSNLRGSRNHLSFSRRTSQHFNKLYTSGVIAGYRSLQGLEGHAAGGQITRSRALTCMSISDGPKPVHNQNRVLSAGSGVGNLELGSRLQPSLRRCDSSSTAIQTQSTPDSSMHECAPCRGFRVLRVQGFHDSNSSCFWGFSVVYLVAYFFKAIKV